MLYEDDITLVFVTCVAVCDFKLIKSYSVQLSQRHLSVILLSTGLNTKIHPTLFSFLITYLILSTRLQNDHGRLIDV